MTARRIREWPRVVVATLALAAVLIVIGVVVASAASGGSSHSSSPRLRRLADRQSAQLRADGQTLAGLRAQLAAESSQLTQARAQLVTARARARCWHELALHRGGKRVSDCAAAS